MQYLSTNFNRARINFKSCTEFKFSALFLLLTPSSPQMISRLHPDPNLSPRPLYSPGNLASGVVLKPEEKPVFTACRAVTSFHSRMNRAVFGRLCLLPLPTQDSVTRCRAQSPQPPFRHARAQGLCTVFPLPGILSRRSLSI